MERDSFVFYRSFYEASKFLSNEDKWKLFDMVCQYGLYWNEAETDWPAMGMFLLIKPQLDANNKKYVNGCKWGEFGTLWWAPQWNKNAVKDWGKIWKQPQNNPKTTPNDNDNVNDNVNENENDVINNTSYYLTDTSELNEWEEKTKLKWYEVITARDVYNAYSTDHKWELKALEKVTKDFSQEDFRRALLEARLVSCEVKLKKKAGERVTYTETCANRIAGMSYDEEAIIDRVDAIIKWFSTFNHRSPKFKEKRDNNIKEWFKDYIQEEELNTTLDWVLKYDSLYPDNIKQFIEKYWEDKYAIVQARRLEYINNWKQPLKSWK